MFIYSGKKKKSHKSLGCVQCYVERTGRRGRASAQVWRTGLGLLEESLLTENYGKLPEAVGHGVIYCYYEVQLITNYV